MGILAWGFLAISRGGVSDDARVLVRRGGWGALVGFLTGLLGLMVGLGWVSRFLGWFRMGRFLCGLDLIFHTRGLR